MQILYCRWAGLKGFAGKVRQHGVSEEVVSLEGERGQKEKTSPGYNLFL